MVKITLKMKNIMSFVIMMETVYRAAGVLTSKTTTSVCQGLTATIDFSINLQGSTYGTGSESWYFGSTQIATNPSGTFSPQGNFSSRLLSYSTYGISLRGVTSTDAGEYLLEFAVTAPTLMVVTATASLTVNIAPASSCVPYYSPTGGTYKCVLNQNAVSNNECGSPILQTNWTNGLGTSDITNIATSGNYTCCAYGIAKNCYNGSYTFCETFSITVPTTPTTSDNEAAKIGGGVGGGVGAVLIASGGYGGYHQYNKKKKEEKAHGEDSEAQKEGKNKDQQKKEAKDETELSAPKHSRSDVSRRDVKIQMEERGVTSNVDRPPATHIRNQNRVESEATSKKTKDRPQPMPPVAVVTEDISKHRPQPPPPENSDVKDPNKRGLSANYDDTQGLPTGTPRPNRLTPLTPKQATVEEEDASKEKPKKK